MLPRRLDEADHQERLELILFTLLGFVSRNEEHAKVSCASVGGVRREMQFSSDHVRGFGGV